MHISFQKITLALGAQARRPSGCLGVGRSGIWPESVLGGGRASWDHEEGKPLTVLCRSHSQSAPFPLG